MTIAPSPVWDRSNFQNVPLNTFIYKSFSWKLDQRGCCFPNEIKINLKCETFKLQLYFWCNEFGEIRGNATMGKCIIMFCAVSLFLVKIATFHGRHLWHGFGKVSWSQIFPWNRSWLNKNRFHAKERGQFLHTNGIYSVLLAINSSKQRKDNQCLARYRWCLLSVYHDIVTCSQQKLKSFFFSFFFFHQLCR